MGLVSRGLGSSFPLFLVSSKLLMKPLPLADHVTKAPCCDLPGDLSAKFTNRCSFSAFLRKLVLKMRQRKRGLCRVLGTGLPLQVLFLASSVEVRYYAGPPTNKTGRSNRQASGV